MSVAAVGVVLVGERCQAAGDGLLGAVRSRSVSTAVDT